MKRTATLEAEAEQEFLAAAAWYENQRAGLGEAFITAVDQAIERIVEIPEASVPVPGVDLPVRRVCTKRFPYSVVFLVVEPHIRVIAVAHMRRKPNYWMSRIGGP